MLLAVNLAHVQLLARRREADRQMLYPVDEVGPEPLYLADQLNRRNSFHQLFEHYVDLHPREARSETEVRPAATERHVLIGRSLDIEAERLWKSILVAIR